MFSAGSTASKNSSHKDGSEASVHQKSRKEMIMEKLREQFFKGKAFILKRYTEVMLFKNLMNLGVAVGEGVGLFFRY